MLTFHLDENVNPAVAVGLRAHRIDVTTPMDVNLIAADDASQLAYAHDEGRVLLTHDDDFLRLHADGRPHSGLLYCHQQKYSVGELVQLLIVLGFGHEPDELIGRLDYL